MTALVTGVQAAAHVDRRPTTIRYWVHRGWLKPRALGPRREQLFALADVFTCEREARRRLQSARTTGGWPRRVAAARAGQDGANTCMVTMGTSTPTRP